MRDVMDGHPGIGGLERQLAQLGSARNRCNHPGLSIAAGSCREFLCAWIGLALLTGGR